MTSTKLSQLNRESCAKLLRTIKNENKQSIQQTNTSVDNDITINVGLNELLEIIQHETSKVTDGILLKLNDVATKINTFETSFNNFKIDIVSRFEFTEKCIDPIDKKLKTCDQSIKNIHKDVSKEISQILSKVNNLSAKAVSPTSSTLVSNSDGMHDVVINAFEEQRSRQEKKNNLIFFGLPEPPQEETAENKVMHDIGLLKDVHTALQVDLPAITKLRRVGRIGTNKPRPVVVHYATEDLVIRQTVLKNAIKLRTIESLSKVYVNPDLTRQEQQIQKNLREECKRRQSKGEKVIIRAGKIVPTRVEVC